MQVSLTPWHGFVHKKRSKYIEKAASAEFIDMDKPKEEAPPPPPPPPPPPAELEQKVKFVAPVVTTEEVVEDADIFNQDDLSKNTINEAVQIEEVVVAVAKVEVIEVEESKKEVFTIVEEMPSFPGGDSERMGKFLADNIQYPQQATENGIQGTVYVSFVVDSKGNITDAKILRGIGGGCDEEALRVVKMMPKWHAGKQNGKQVRVLFNMPIYFKLQG